MLSVHPPRCPFCLQFTECPCAMCPHAMCPCAPRGPSLAPGPPITALPMSLGMGSLVPNLELGWRARHDQVPGALAVAACGEGVCGAHGGVGAGPLWPEPPLQAVGQAMLPEAADTGQCCSLPEGLPWSDQALASRSPASSPRPGCGHSLVPSLGAGQLDSQGSLGWSPLKGHWTWRQRAAECGGTGCPARVLGQQS